MTEPRRSMVVMLLPINGVGLGHLSRAFAFAGHLQECGDAPVIFAQGSYPDFMARRVPGVSVGVIYKMSPDLRTAAAAELERYASLTTDPVLVEDTHPAPFTLSPSIRRYMVVRPTSMEYLRLMRSRYSATYRAFAIADHPDSPTWPFSTAETAEIVGWESWCPVGPLSRVSTATTREQVRRKYAIRPGTELFVFSMGGGGVQQSSAGEVAHFCERCLAIGETIRCARPRSRLLFVRGPLFPADRRIPSLFEDVHVEPEMPALLALAAGAVVRPGYNTTWECILGGTPIMAVEGTTFEEPVAERLARLEECGLLATSVEQLTDPQWTTDFRGINDALIARWAPAQACHAIRGILAGHQPSRPLQPPLLVDPRSPSDSASPSAMRLLVRIDDVVEIDENLLATLASCAAHQLCVSLEVVPYLCQTDEEALHRVANASLQFEVSQHGFAHLPRRNREGRKAEFTESHLGANDLARGIAIMQARFPTTFHGGFSAPYDSAPIQLYRRWFEAGGRYASVSQHRLRPWPPHIVRLTLEPWDWLRNGPFSEDQVFAEAAQCMRERGYVGLVLHPRLFRVPGELRRVEFILRRLLDFGCRSAFVSEVALGTARPAPSC